MRRARVLLPVACEAKGASVRSKGSAGVSPQSTRSAVVARVPTASVLTSPNSQRMSDLAPASRAISRIPAPHLLKQGQLQLAAASFRDLAPDPSGSFRFQDRSESSELSQRRVGRVGAKGRRSNVPSIGARPFRRFEGKPTPMIIGW